jgi:hypothetical protein
MSTPTLVPSLALALALVAAPLRAQTPAAPTPGQERPRTASVNTQPRVDAETMARPIDMHDSVWIEELSVIVERELG